MIAGAPLAQVAFSVVDLVATERWFREGLGFRPAGGSRWRMRGPLASAVQGLPRVASTCWWMVDRNEFFQLELFQFEHPLARLVRPDFRPCDLGYTRVGVWVADFDEALARLERLGSPPLADPIGSTGTRRACVRNPDGVYVEVMEDDPLIGAGSTPSRPGRAAVRSVTLSVPDLARSAAFFSRGIGLRRSDAALHAPEHETLWGLSGARTRSRVFAAGSVLVEVVQYVEPAGRSRAADYRISDQGIVNIAFGSRSRRAHRGAPSSRLRRWGTPQLQAGSPAGRRRRVRHRSGRLLRRAAVDVAGFGRGSGDSRRVRPPRGRGPTRTPSSGRSGSRRPRGRRGMRSRRTRTCPRGLESEVSAGPSKAPRRPMAAAPSVWCGLRARASPNEWSPMQPPIVYRYHVTAGSPFVCHQGEIRLRADGDHTEVAWRIRFRPKLPGTGRPLATALSRLLGRVLSSGLKPHVEALARLERV